MVVVGAGNSGGQAAVHLARYAAQVTIVARGQSLSTTMSDYLVREIEASPRIVVRTDTDIVDGGGDGQLEWLELADRASAARDRIPAAGLFILIGTETRSNWLPAEIQRDSKGFVAHRRRRRPARWPLARPPQALETSVPGVFAAGDVRANNVKRVASAVGEGSISVPMVHKFLEELRAGTSSNRRSRWWPAGTSPRARRGGAEALSSTYRTGRRSLPAHGAWITLAFVITDLAASREGMVAVRDGERWLLENRAMKDGVLDRLLVRVSGGRPWKSVGGDDGRTWSEPRLGMRGDAGEMSTPVLVRMEPPRCPNVTSAGGDTPWRHRATYDNLMTAHPPRVPFPRLRDERRTTPSINCAGEQDVDPGDETSIL